MVSREEREAFARAVVFGREMARRLRDDEQDEEEHERCIQEAQALLRTLADAVAALLARGG